jgi:vitamin B12 transporter
VSLLAVLFLLAQQQINQTIIVTASEIPETVESTPASVTVITRKDIDAQKARDISDVLREVPGLSVSRTGSDGKVTSVFVRGASSKQVLVLWNGVEINDPYFSGYNFGQFSTVGVQRIEIARGPFSSLYGADAVGGVINIITTGGQNQTDVDVAGGGRGLINGVASLQQTFGPTTFSVAAEHRQDNGFAPNDNDRRNSVVGALTFAPASTVSIGLAGRASNYDLGVPRNTNDTATAYMATPHHRENGSEWQLAVPVTAEIGATHAEVRLAENRRDDRNEDPDSQSFGATRSNRQTVRLSARRATPIGTLVVGGEGEKDEATNHDSFGLDLATHHRTSDAVFVEDRFSRGPFELSAGARYDHYQTFGSETSPRIGVAWSRDGNKIHAAYGQSFRAPQIGELYLPFFGNPNLQAERSHSEELGYNRFFASGALVSITAFRNTFRDLIMYDLVANRFANVGLARSRGVEFAASDRRGPLTASVTYTFLRAVEEPSGAELPRRPKHSGSLELGYTRGAGSAELVVARVGSRADVNDLVPFDNVTNRAFTVADLTLRWNARIFEPYAKIENLTNTRYQEVFGFPSPTRRALIGVRYTISR